MLTVQACALPIVLSLWPSKTFFFSLFLLYLPFLPSFDCAFPVCGQEMLRILFIEDLLKYRLSKDGNWRDVKEA